MDPKGSRQTSQWPSATWAFEWVWGGRLLALGATVILPEATLLIIDDDPIVITALSRMLSSLGRSHFALNGPDGLALAAELHPDVILLDIDMPTMSGLEVCRSLKADPASRDIPVMFITGQDDLEHEVEALELGAEDFISKPPRAPQVLARVRSRLQMKHLADQLRHSAHTDPLTGLANRRQFDERLAGEWSRAQRSGLPLSLLMIDVDHFKAYNDFYGHPAGDVCLKVVAQSLQRSVRRPTDVLARYGGEEFVALLPETGPTGAQRVAELMLEELQRVLLVHERSPSASHVTASIGVSTYHRETHGRRGSSELIEAADRGLYAAKQRGRKHARFSELTEPRGDSSPVDPLAHHAHG